MAHDGTPITDFGAIAMIAMSGKGVAGEHVSLKQQPGGGTKQVVVRENRIITLDPNRFPNVSPDAIHYQADTEPGSSGAAVFNDQWDLVAIHHLAIADLDGEGRTLNRRGDVWSPAEGEDAKHWVANEGVRISSIWNHLRKAAAFDPNAAKIMAMMAFDPKTNHQPAPVGAGFGDPQKWQTLPSIGQAPPFESTRFTDPAFVDSQGYKPDFLGKELVVDLPKTAASFHGRLAVNSVTNGQVFDYTHFSLAMHADRRLALWTAVNIDGGQLKSTASPRWRRDRRLPPNEQTLAEIYGEAPGKRIQIDRGHLVRRLDPVWGDQAVADRAGDDTFPYTNAAPQEHVYSSEVWGNLEDFVLARADNRSHKASVFTGPVLRPDDDFFGEDLKGGPWQIPWSFWKIAIFKRDDGTASVTGFIVEQTSNIAPLFESNRYNPYSVEEARVYQRPILLIEQLTGLDFGKLRAMDKMGVVETSSALAARYVGGVEDVIF